MYQTEDWPLELDLHSNQKVVSEVDQMTWNQPSYGQQGAHFECSLHRRSSIIILL